MKNIKKLALLFVLIITVYGIWCIWDYLNLFREGRIGCWRGSIYCISLCFVPLIGIWLSWNGLRNLIYAGQDWNRSVGYMKIMGGTALIIIINLFLYVMTQ